MQSRDPYTRDDQIRPTEFDFTTFVQPTLSSTSRLWIFLFSLSKPFTSRLQPYNSTTTNYLVQVVRYYTWQSLTSLVKTPIIPAKVVNNHSNTVPNIALKPCFSRRSSCPSVIRCSPTGSPLIQISPVINILILIIPGLAHSRQFVSSQRRLVQLSRVWNRIRLLEPNTQERAGREHQAKPLLHIKTSSSNSLFSSQLNDNSPATDNPNGSVPGSFPRRQADWP